MEELPNSDRTAVMVNYLKAEKETFWIENQLLPEEHIQRRWLGRTAELKRELSSVFEPTPPLQQNSLLTVEDVSRPTSQHVLSYPQLTPDMTRGPSISSFSQGLDRTNSLSQQSTPMSRKRSSSSQHGPIPISGSGSTMQTLPLNRWQADDVEPFSSLGRPSKLQRTGLALQPTVVIYENPEDFWSMSETAQPSLSPAGPSKYYSRRNSYRLSSSPRQAFAFNSSLSQSPTTPMTGELTNATTLTSDSMSRQSSHGGSLCGGLDMMKINSQTSDPASLFPYVELESPCSKADADLAVDPRSAVHFSPLPEHSNLNVDDRSSPSSSISSRSNPFALPPTLENSSSTKLPKSAETPAPSQTRISRRSLTEVNQNTRPIAPKLHRKVSFPIESPAGNDLIRVEPDEGISKAAVPIPKAPYVRPSHDKVKCNQCNEHPNGFRGDHELRRHTERKHSRVRKYFTCKDISPDKKFLASCKACASNKKYNAYYNATAHLRRSHFNPKQKGRKGKIEPEDRRGGKGGGTEPSMQVLKEWLEYHEERVPANTQPSIDEFGDNEDGEVPYEPIESPEFPQTTIFAGPQRNAVSSQPSAPNFTNHNASHFVNEATQPLLSAPATIPQLYNSDCLQLTASVANPSDLFDLSLDTSINDPSMTDSAELLFPFDISMSSYLPDGFNNPSFP